MKWDNIYYNVFKIRPVVKQKKLSIHDSLILIIVEHVINMEFLYYIKLKVIIRN